ncbi:MAG: hypothetical protein GC182_13425 [Rhodopseudomonas sp.]|nr:hypothetical protein [Rhodopseudomonas sp.]
MAGLKTYRAKRRFDVTAEPKGKITRKSGHAYVIQKHAARRLHYDLRLELDGVMKSWAVTRGPSLVAGEKRLAVQVEDHPLAYNSFEGTIPRGEYGGGTVMVWDRGNWKPQEDAHKGLKKGHLSFVLNGKKLHGLWHLVRMHRRRGETHDNWLLIKADDEAARRTGDQDILDEATRSAKTGRTLEEIAAGQGKTARPTGTSAKTRTAAATARRIAKSTTTRQRAAGTAQPPPHKRRARSGEKVIVEGITLSHPDRLYWDAVKVTKQDLAAYYRDVWTWMAPHVVGRPISLVRCPDGIGGTCFFQKHAAAGIATDHLHLIPEKDDKIISIDDLAGLISLVQAGVLEIHTRGSTAIDRDNADRLVFDLDPGPGTDWSDVVAAARAVRKKLTALKLKSFLKTSGGKGLHVVVPVAPTPWARAKTFAQRIASSMAAESPELYVATATKSKRNNRIFIDYLRNSHDATTVAPFSTRARLGAAVSTPIGWSELGKLKGADDYTLRNLPARLKRLRRDPWSGIGRIKQKLPSTI